MMSDYMSKKILDLIIALYRQYLIDTGRVMIPAMTGFNHEISPLFSRVEMPTAPNPLAWFDDLSFEDKLDEIADDSGFMDTVTTVLGTPALWRNVWDKRG